MFGLNTCQIKVQTVQVNIKIAWKMSDIHLLFHALCVTMIVDNTPLMLRSRTRPLDAAGVEAGPPGLLVVQATQLLSVVLLLIIQVGHSHDPSAGLNF